ncbi:MAG: hypothetical protein JNK30_12225 [Phenylobacterium sp.]|uniref:hypothetical protein n=1 Tax=Phenylobacterium sp. TaxID=1871053 RepID=UPI001A62299B|nr:hypothetical protein [Phenylobacterium sp.]MBL8772140.1 hypothetical protein [Phenylobacterium sp.]
MLSRGVLAALAILLAPAGAAAEEAAALAVRIGGDEIRMPVPAGYCEPTGRYANIAQLTDAMDRENITYLALVDCAAVNAGRELSRYLFLRAPKVFASERLTREQLFERMGPMPENAPNLLLDNPAMDQAKGAARRATGRNVELSGEMRPVAKDEAGYYMAGGLQQDDAGRSRRTSVGIGATAVRGHVVTVNSYVRGSDLAAVREALKVARETTQGLVAANP